MDQICTVVFLGSSICCHQPACLLSSISVPVIKIQEGMKSQLTSDKENTFESLCTNMSSAADSLHEDSTKLKEERLSSVLGRISVVCSN